MTDLSHSFHSSQPQANAGLPASTSITPPVLIDLPDLRRRILANEPLELEELRQAVAQLRANRTAPPEKKASGSGSRKTKAVQAYALDDLLG